jgi:4-hydroxy-tetrahydrodipicolinate synthase
MTASGQRFTGTFPAIVTPFTEDGGRVDFDSLKELLDFQIGHGISGVVVCGSTGETATLSEDEYHHVVSFTRDYVGSRATVVAGIGASSTTRALELAAFLESVGVDGILLVTPPYNKPTQNGLLAHFAAVRAAVDTPIIAYNVPGRTGVNLLPKTVGRLVDEGLIAGLKESSGSIDQVLDIVSLVGSRIALLSGEDSLIHTTMACGGVGAVSVVANIEPALVVRITAASLSEEWRVARDAQLQMLPLARAVFTETNPIPIKAALWLKGLIRYPTTRLPLTPAEPQTIETLKRVLAL